MRRPWFAIIWFAVWSIFQAFAVGSVLAGTWQRPEAFPKEAYDALAYPDMAFIPVYLLTSVLLLMRRKDGAVLALAAGGGTLYALLYLFALSGFTGTTNLVADGIFLLCTVVAMWQATRHLFAGESTTGTSEIARHAV